MIYIPLMGGLCNILFQIANAYALVWNSNDKNEPIFSMTNEHIQVTTHRPSYESTLLSFLKRSSTIPFQRPIKYQEQEFVFRPIHYNPSQNWVISGYFQSGLYFQN